MYYLVLVILATQVCQYFFFNYFHYVKRLLLELGFSFNLLVKKKLPTKKFQNCQNGMLFTFEFLFFYSN